jgi:hypothetical protein
MPQLRGNEPILGLNNFRNTPFMRLMNIVGPLVNPKGTTTIS